MHDN
jgi:hypothetical protein